MAELLGKLPQKLILLWYFLGGLKCPRKIRFDTQFPPPFCDYVLCTYKNVTPWCCTLLWFSHHKIDKWKFKLWRHISVVQLWHPLMMLCLTIYNLFKPHIHLLGPFWITYPYMIVNRCSIRNHSHMTSNIFWVLLTYLP
jgi:hypothetical protein